MSKVTLLMRRVGVGLHIPLLPCGLWLPSRLEKGLRGLSVSLESLTFLKGLCLLKVSVEGSHRHQAYKDHRLVGTVTRKEKPGKWGLLLGRQRVNRGLTRDQTGVPGGELYKQTALILQDENN